MPGLTDVHTHIIYGIDDGAASLDVMLKMIDAAYENGVRTIFATSHQTPGYQAFDLDTYLAHLDEAREYCRTQGYDLEILPGAEHLYTPAMRNVAEEGTLQTLGDTDTILIEFVPDVPYSDICAAIELLHHAGYRPMLAHIERYACLSPKLLGRGKAYELKKKYRNLLFQVNCRSVLEAVKQESGYGRAVHKWLKDGLIDAVASDMHDCKHRRNRMAEARDVLIRICGKSYANELMSFSNQD